MSTQVTLNIPDNIYQQVEETARTTNRRVSEVITETLAQSFLLHETQSDQEDDAPGDFFSVSEHRPKMLKEVDAYEQMHAELWEEYPNKYVAIYQGQLVDHDENLVTLEARVRQKYPYPEYIVLIRQVQRDPRPVLYFRSPRLVRE